MIGGVFQARGFNKSNKGKGSMITVQGNVLALRCNDCNKQIAPSTMAHALEFARDHRFHKGYNVVVELTNGGAELAGAPLEIEIGRIS